MKLLSTCFFLVLLGINNSLLAEEQKDWSKIVFYKDGRSPNVNSILPFLNSEEQEMHIQAEEMGREAFSYVVYKNNSSYFLQIDCHLNYWKWDGIVWEPQVDLDHIGFNCGAHFIFRENNIFSLGGYGFWKNSSDLVKLNPGSGQAEFVEVQNQPLNYYSGTTFQLEDGVLNLYGELLNVRLTTDVKRVQGKFLDLGNLEWKEIQWSWSNAQIRELIESDCFLPAFPLDLKDYGLLFFNKQGTIENGLLIFDKRDWSISFIEGPFFDIISIEWYMVNDENDIFFKRVNLDEVILFQVDPIVSKAQIVGKIQIIEPDYFFRGWEWFGVIFLLAFFGFLIWRIGNKPMKQASFTLEPNPDSIQIENRFSDFLLFQDQLLTQEKIDELLGLDPRCNFDLRKVKRARLLKKLNEEFENEFGFPLVTRVRDQKDKRMILYGIGSFSMVKGV